MLHTTEGVHFSRFFYRIICLVLLLAWAFVTLHWRLTAWLPDEQDNTWQLISIRLMDFPKVRDGRWQGDFYSPLLAGKLRLSFPEGEFPISGCVYTVKAKLKKPRGFYNINLFDYQAWLLQAGYTATGYVKDIIRCDEVPVGFLFGLRESIAKRIEAVPISDKARSTLLALLIGSYADIDLQQWHLLRDSGTVHILSVSGLHIVLVAGLAYMVVSCLFRHLVFPLRWLPAPHWGGMASVLFSIAYALLADFSVPTQRSLIMVTVAVMQRLLCSQFRLLTAWKVSLVIIVLSDPLSVLSCGFWFSFTGTAVLILVYHGVIGNIHWFTRYCITNGLLFLSMVPLSLYLYGYVPLLSLPANSIAVPLISFLSLPLAFIGLLFMPFSDVVSDTFLRLSAWTLDGYWFLMQWLVEAVYGSKWYWGGATILPVALSVAGLSLLLLPKGFPLRGFSLLLCLPLVFPDVFVPRQGEFEMTMLDVGQGLAIVVRTARHVMVYDTGDRFTEQFDAGRDIVVPYLRSLRESSIHMLMVSHGDKDHAGGVPGILAALPVRQTWSGTPDLLPMTASVAPCRAGMHWRWDGVDFQVLSPPLASERDRSNNRSCVLKIDDGHQSVLLTGDAEQAVESRLLRTGAALAADVLVAPHHGSKTSSSSLFIQAVSPSLALVSAGYKNRFHHPSPIVLARYARQGVRWLSTQGQGAIRIRSQADGIHISSALCERPVPWRTADACRQDRL